MDSDPPQERLVVQVAPLRAHVRAARAPRADARRQLPVGGQVPVQLLQKRVELRLRQPRRVAQPPLLLSRSRRALRAHHAVQRL